MKKPVLAAAVVLTLFAAAAASAETLRIVTRENALRQECRFFAPVILMVSYGSPLEVVSREGDWIWVKFKNTKGCVHKTAVTEQRISPAGTAAVGGGTSAEEVALASKGFTPEVEQSYRAKYPELNFQLVDRIESYRLPESVFMKFVREGGLRQP